MRKNAVSTSDLAQVARGFLMGGADIIPGVSGGTVALILGIYDRLIRAISHFDVTFIRHIRKRQWTDAALYIDLRFLITLGCGIVLGIGGLATLMHHLLEHHLQITFAAFFGLIVASSFLVAQMVQRWTLSALLGLAGGAAAALVIVGLPLLESPPAGDGYVFLCGTVAICAMILPGISGAFVLLILGKYSDITGLLEDVLHGDISIAGLVTIGVFCTGCLVGLLSFSKVLRWLLARHESQTMAILCGFMIGSLRKIWPFKRDLTPTITEFKHNKRFENIWPEQFDGETLLAIGVAAAAVIFVLLLDRVTKGHKHIPPLKPDEQNA